ncbi:hypothetical protein [Geodermatophilus sp. SYSU D01105]
MRGRRPTRSRVISIEVGPRNLSYLQGTGLTAVLDELGVPYMRDPLRQVLCCPSNRLDDVLAVLEHRDGRAVELLAVD